MIREFTQLRDLTRKPSILWLAHPTTITVPDRGNPIRHPATPTTRIAASATYGSASLSRHLIVASGRQVCQVYYCHHIAVVFNVILHTPHHRFRRIYCRFLPGLRYYWFREAPVDYHA